MTEATAQEKETRQGIRFRGKISFKDRSVKRAELYIEGQKSPVYVLDRREIHSSPYFSMIPQGQLVDKMFQDFVKNGRFYDVVRDPSHIGVLRVAQMERLEETPWYMRTYRFLKSGDDYSRDLSDENFILTPDKRDLPRDLQIANTDPKSHKKILKHRKREEEREKLGYRKTKREEEKLRREHSQEIESAVFSAINNEQFPEGLVKRLDDLGLLRPSTNFRSGALFLGEALTFFYDFKREGVEHMGYLGFGENLELISIDERVPQDRQRYNDPKEKRFVPVD